MQMHVQSFTIQPETVRPLLATAEQRYMRSEPDSYEATYYAGRIHVFRDLIESGASARVARLLFAAEDTYYAQGGRTTPVGRNAEGRIHACRDVCRAAGVETPSRSYSVEEWFSA